MLVAKEEREAYKLATHQMRPISRREIKHKGKDTELVIELSTGQLRYWKARLKELSETSLDDYIRKAVDYKIACDFRAMDLRWRDFIASRQTQRTAKQMIGYEVDVYGEDIYPETPEDRYGAFVEETDDQDRDEVALDEA
jgi:hypothetical protein